METMWVYVCQTDWVTPKGELGGGQALKEGSCLVSCLSLCFTNPQTYTHTHITPHLHTHTQSALLCLTLIPRCCQHLKSLLSVGAMQCTAEEKVLVCRDDNRKCGGSMLLHAVDI